MCCPGCQAVAEAIVAGGLESYYQHRSEASANPEALPVQLTDELALYDRADVQQPFVRHDGELAETTLMIEGISCAACGWLIEKHLRELSSISAANLNLSNHRLYLSWDDSQLALSQILQTLRSIGYAAHPYQADQAVEQLAQENRRALRQLGVAGMLWMQVMMAAMATWPEFNVDLTPELDKLAQTGWNFRRAYATGTRSVRGLEAVSAGFPPTVADAVLRLPGSQTRFFTLAQLLKEQGYRSRLIYGGEAPFDNMKSFFLGNGFDELYEQSSFESPEFVGTWGASAVRCAVATASSRALPELWKGSALPSVVVTMAIWPLSRSFIAGPLPR